MKNLAAQRERAMNAVNGLTFEQVETAAQVMEFAVQKYGNQPSILAGLAFMAGVAVGKSESGSGTNEKSVSEAATAEDVVRCVHAGYAGDISDDIEAPLRRLADVMFATVAHYEDIQAEKGCKLTTTEANEAVEYLETFARSVRCIQENALAISKRADNAALGVAD